MTWRISDPAHLLAAMRISLLQGGEWLAGRVAPNGPIAHERNLNYMHKAVWGMYAGGVDPDVIARVLDWAEREALQPNGDFYFPEESPEYKDTQRVYRPLTFGKVAAWIGHPVIRRAQVIDRILQYQHASGGAFNFIGDDPRHVEPSATLGTLNTTFFGQLMLALDLRSQALAAGKWVLSWVDANRSYMPQGFVYTQMTPEGELITTVGPGERIGKVVDNRGPKQEFWQIGTAMAYLVDLYEAMRVRWDYPEAQARPYLDAALALLDFEATMPLDTYLWPSKCKVGWGAGELLRVLAPLGPARPLAKRGGVLACGVAEQRLGDARTMETAYRVGERVAMFTFMDNQLGDGSWSQLHYPLQDGIPELDFSYKPLKGSVRVTPWKIAGSQTIWLPAEELAGEFLGELKPIEQGVAAWLKAGAS